MSPHPLPPYRGLREAAHRPDEETETQYRIRVKGHLDPSWQEWLEGFRISHQSDGTSVLTGTLPDQPALYGILVKISNLGVRLLSLDSDGMADHGD